MKQDLKHTSTPTETLLQQCKATIATSEEKRGGGREESSYNMPRSASPTSK
jgi:hypothetical protein